MNPLRMIFGSSDPGKITMVNHYLKRTMVQPTKGHPTDRKDRCIHYIAGEHRNASKAEITNFFDTKVTQ
ncbi:hypothetical protein TNCV_3595961 [Trichonephila clavipes]|nr:hypothetical protein TNCV_3595961 [Trichonephila clavipes]